MGIHSAQDQYLRLQEFPFNSDQKMMAVKCVPKGHTNTNDVSCIFDMLCFFGIYYHFKILYVILQFI